MQDIYALSIAGPFGYWVASAKKTADSIKSIEVRSWKRNLAPGTVVLIHTSSNCSYDHYSQPLGIDLSNAPKFSILGAVGWLAQADRLNRHKLDIGNAIHWFRRLLSGNKFISLQQNCSRNVQGIQSR